MIYIATFKVGESSRTEIRIGSLNLEEAQEKAAARAFSFLLVSKEFGMRAPGETPLNSVFGSLVAKTPFAELAIVMNAA